MVCILATFIHCSLQNGSHLRTTEAAIAENSAFLLIILSHGLDFQGLWTSSYIKQLKLIPSG